MPAVRLGAGALVACLLVSPEALALDGGPIVDTFASPPDGASVPPNVALVRHDAFDPGPVDLRDAAGLSIQTSPECLPADGVFCVDRPLEPLEPGAYTWNPPGVPERASFVVAGEPDLDPPEAASASMIVSDGDAPFQASVRFSALPEGAFALVRGATFQGQGRLLAAAHAQTIVTGVIPVPDDADVICVEGQLADYALNFSAASEDCAEAPGGCALGAGGVARADAAVWLGLAALLWGTRRRQAPSARS